MTTAYKQTARSIAYVAATILAVGMGLSANAQAAETQVFTKLVQYGDLNLDTPEGARALYDRLRAASMEVCGVVHTKDLSMLQSYKSCYDAAMSKAVGDIRKVELTALYNAKARPAKG